MSGVRIPPGSPYSKPLSSNERILGLCLEIVVQIHEAAPLYYEDVMNTAVQDAINNFCTYTVPIDGEIVGSSTIPGLSPRDHDVLILVGKFDAFTYKRAGLVQTSAAKEKYQLEVDGPFQVWTDEKRNVDFIITRSEELYQKFKDANELCIRLNLKKRDDRVRLFQYIVYGKMT